MGDFHICEPEEGRFSVWNQTFTESDMEKPLFFHSLFPRVLEIAQRDYTKRDSSMIVDYTHAVEDWSSFYQYAFG